MPIEAATTDPLVSPGARAVMWYVTGTQVQGRRNSADSTYLRIDAKLMKMSALGCALTASTMLQLGADKPRQIHDAEGFPLLQDVHLRSQLRGVARRRAGVQSNAM